MIAARRQRTSQRRLRQFLSAVFVREDAAVDATIRAELSDDRQWRLVQRLSPSDRRHVLAVHRMLRDQGYHDADLLRAALLHDVGKADEHGRVRVMHRVLRVVGGAISPAAVGWLAHRSHGLHLVLNHAGHGTRLANEAGASDRCCWLIEHHEDLSIDDAELRALIAADGEAIG